MANDMKTLKVIAENGTFAFPVKDQTARDAAAEAQTAADGAQTAAQEAKEAAQTAQGMAQSASNAAGNAQQTAAAAQATAQAAKQAADGITIPTVLPNPFKLMFTGGATGEYDGSKAVTINIPTGGEGGGSGPVQYVESLDESNLANLRDLTTGTYVLYGYFVPFAGSSDTMTCDNTLVSVAHLSAGSHVLVFNPLNCKVNFIEILVDESAASGFTYSVQIIDMRDLPALIEAVGSRDSLTTDDKSTIVAAINEVAQKGGTVTDEQIASAVEDYMAEHPVTGGGLTTEQINALDNMFKVCAFTKADVSAEYNAFCAAFGIEGGIVPDEPDEPVTPAVTLTSISATYSGGNVAVGTAVNDLTGIVVTAHYSDGTSESVTGYTLSGTIAEGSNTITVTYQSKTATFTVTGVAESGGGSSVTTVSLCTNAGYIKNDGVSTANVTNGYHSDNIESATIKSAKTKYRTAFITNGYSAFWFYDAEGNVLSGTNGTTSEANSTYSYCEITESDIPADAKYVKIVIIYANTSADDVDDLMTVYK